MQKEQKKRENPYEEKLKDGFIRLPNEMIEKVYQQYFRPNENKVFWFIVRKTWGWKKFKEFISLSQFENSLKLKKDKICKALLLLKQRNIIAQLGNKTYAIQMDYSKWIDRPKKNKKIAQLDNKNSQIKPGKGKGNFIAQLDKDKKIAQLDNSIAQLDNKISLKHTPTVNPQTPKDTYLKDKKTTATTKGEKPVVADSFFSIQPETKEKLQEQGLANRTIRELILKVIKFTSNVDEYFEGWLAENERNPKKNFAGFLITMVENKQFPPKQDIPAYLKTNLSEEMLKEAKKDLEKSASVDRICEWLHKLPESQHGELERWYKRKYPKEKFWVPAEVKYYQSKKENQDGWGEPIDSDEEVARRLKIIKREKHIRDGEIA